jgi:2-phospho-L-lactate/phosphoenolpyruvate guanylyltransferase
VVDSPTVLVPVKRGNPKSRLTPILDRDDRRELVRRMLKDVMGTLRASGLIRQTYIISSDEEILRYTSGLGAEPIAEVGERGVSAAVEWGMRETHDAEGWLILPSDIPFLTTQDVSRVLEFNEAGMEVVLAPSREFNGTNLLLFERGYPVKLSYDKDSFSNHLAAAARSGYTVAVYCSRTVTLDLDSIEDIRLALSFGVKNVTTSFLESKQVSLKR